MTTEPPKVCVCYTDPLLCHLVCNTVSIGFEGKHETIVPTVE